MSEHSMLMGDDNKDKDEENNVTEVINAYEPNHINELAVDESLRLFYRSLEFPCCGDYLEPNLQPIIDKKTQLHKEFVDGREQQSHKISHYDGIFDNLLGESQSTNELIRLKSRLVRDKREEYFQQNSEFVIDTSFFYEQLSRLANISYEENQAIQTFQKNAILSERNNQKKSTPFELEINIGYLWLTKHELQNEEEKKFEEIRPLLKEFSNLSTYPILSEISNELDYLKKVKHDMIENRTSEDLEEIERKIERAEEIKNKEKVKVERVMKEILDKWKEIKEIRRSTFMETVPWKLNIKRDSEDIGLTQTEVSDRPTGEKAESELERRANIRDERYLIIIYINGNEVAKSQKVHLQWPSYRVPINEKFNVTVYSAPSSIQVEIVKVGIINKIVDTINLNLPGVNSKTITASERRYASANFASNGHNVRKEREELAPPAGLVVYRIEWKGEGSRMPPVSFKAQEEETISTEPTEEDEIDSTELYDMKDPRLPQKSKKDEVDAEIYKQKAALLPFINTQSARHLLLKMKATQPEFEKISIPLTEEEIRKRHDLLTIIEKEREKRLDNIDDRNEEIYHPAEGFIFKKQDEEKLKEIKGMLFKMNTLKLNNSKNNSSAKYKITEEIIKEYIFEQMQSPIVVFFKNLFTQKRKLGPNSETRPQSQSEPAKIEINVHLRSAKNVPIRESSFSQIKQFKEEEERLERMRRDERGNFMMGERQQHWEMAQNRMNEMVRHTGGNVDALNNYGMGFYQRGPNFGMQGQNFFIPGQLNNQIPSLELNYNLNKINLLRNNTFVEMRFKKKLLRTECFEGPFPEWNETIEFDYELKKQNMTIKKLYANNEKNISLFLFDMIEESKPTTVVSEVRIKKTKYFLGKIEFPISTMVAIPSLTGIFGIERPLVIFGYGIKKAGLFDREEIEEANKTESPETFTFLNIDIFSEPLIENFHAYNEDRKFVTGEGSPMLLQKASDWMSDLNTKLYIRLWLNNIEGKSVFICRFLSENIAPPKEILDSIESIERCARFVSMIPKKYNCKLLENTEEFHLTCDQLLSVKMGEDHGILLCNYFNYIDKKCGRHDIHSYLAIGKAFPYGKTIFVLRRDSLSGDSELWDPFTGYCYFFKAKEYDTICCFFKYSKKKETDNLKDICNMIELTELVTPTNVYINIQESLKPIDLDFNFEDDKLWKPFLNERYNVIIFRMRIDFKSEIEETIQEEIAEDYYPDISNLSEELRVNIRQRLRECLEKDRKEHVSPKIFKFNDEISNAIEKDLLIKCENFKQGYRLTGQNSTLYMDYNGTTHDKYHQVLESLENEKNQIKNKVYSDKMLYGVTLNMPFTTIKDICEKVQETQIHMDEDNSLDIVVGVQCFELACHIFSVWVFIGTIA